ncbi:tetratricopeptide repeat protein [Thiomicrospira microaerophila]|uniref:tetratricopeptide repeat protein n=1 Tax=Thiomicrospira microaerophila TaxID=406020 RepID=UPI0005C864F1|nr:hypothetical protein [Thiomicrospira microaerophila]
MFLTFANKLLRFALGLKRVVYDTQSMPLKNKLYAARMVYLLETAQHDKLAQQYQKTKSSFPGLANYYLAHSLSLKAQYEAAIDHLQVHLDLATTNTEAAYLACELYYNTQQRPKAWALLEKIVQETCRLKTWLIMAQLVQDKSDFERWLSNLQQAQAQGKAPQQHANLRQYYIQAASRAGEYEQAINRAIENITDPLPSPIKKLKYLKKARFTPKQAAIVLQDLKTALDQASIEFFLVSGTLLGAVREGQLLAHDKDLDIGIWQTTTSVQLIQALGKTGKFKLNKSRSPFTIKIQHINGIPVDIFYHIKTPDTYYHEVLKCTWHNAPFTLAELEFLGDTYLVPDPPERYLAENYGEDWRQPKKEFDSGFETPNIRVNNKGEMIVHLINQLYRNPNPKTQSHYLEQLQQLGLDQVRLEKIKNKLEKKQ